MDLLRLLFTVIWGVLTLVASGFVLWRKLRHERVDFEDKIIDRAFLALLAGTVVGRLAFVFFHFSAFGWDLGKWLSLSGMPGILEVPALSAGLLVFWLTLGRDWRDSIEILDYASIGLAFFLLLISLGDLLSQMIGYLFVSNTQSAAGLSTLDPTYLVWSVVSSVLFLSLFFFLSRLEQRYRTFLWYRAKKRSAQTGFLCAVFLICYGFFGTTLGWFRPATTTIAGVSVDPVLRLLVMIAGIVLLYVRSGRSLFPKN